MGKPSEQQIRQFETIHKGQFANLVIANRLFLRVMLPKAAELKRRKDYATNKAAQKAVADVMAYGNLIKNLAFKWYLRQNKFETRAGVPKVAADLMKYFFSLKDEQKLINLAKNYISPTDTTTLKKLGLGFVPLLIWAVIAIVAAFTAYEIVNETTTTAQEKAELLQQTETTLKNLNIPPDKAAAIVTQTQQQATETGGGLMSNITGGAGTIVPIALVAAAIYFITKNK